MANSVATEDPHCSNFLLYGSTSCCFSQPWLMMNGFKKYNGRQDGKRHSLAPGRYTSFLFHGRLSSTLFLPSD